jgi:hypothetical protein
MNANNPISQTDFVSRQGIHMTTYIPAPDPITPAWLTAVLRASGALAHGEVLAVSSAPTGAFNSQTSHLQLHYSDDAAPRLTANLILKRNISEPWGIEAGAQEVAFYQLIAALPNRPPADAVPGGGISRMALRRAASRRLNGFLLLYVYFSPSGEK